MTQWEYNFFFHTHSPLIDKDVDSMMYDNENLQKQLNGFGGQGWESYAVIQKENKTYFYFKRPIKKTQ